MNRRTAQHNRWFSCLANACLLTIGTSTAVFATQEEIKPIESTMAYKLLTIESGVREVPTGAENLLRSVINDATDMALKKNRNPRTREEALDVLGAIQLALVRHNFLQPPEEKDWPQTMGIAFKPLTFTTETQEKILNFPDNKSRKDYLDLAKPLYFVDCDMGSQLFMAVGERLGWDIRLVELPRHNFVRWNISTSINVNWDWVYGRSIDDDVYISAIPASEDIRLRAVYMRSLKAEEARAYYLGLIGSEAKRPRDGERLLQEAVTVLPNHPLTLNNFAWLYATTPEFANQKSDLAVAYGLAAWSMRSDYGNFADTAACAFAANGKKQLAEQVEEFAIALPDNAGQREGFKKNLVLIKAGALCH
jgi:hypothetical protein